MLRLLSLTCLLLAAIPAAAEPRTPTPKPIAERCAPTAGHTWWQGGARVGKLGDEPPAAQVRTVYRTDADGCPTPVVLREGIGANPHKARPLARGVRLHPAR